MTHTFQVKSRLFGNFEIMDYEPTPKQVAVLNSLENNNFNVIRKSRQVGVTTTLSVAIANKMLSVPDSRICLVTHKSAMGNYTKDLLIDLFQSIGVTEFDELNKYRVSLPNGSYISFITSIQQFSAQTWDWVVFDEAAYIKDLDSMIGRAKGMANCDITLASTPTNKHTEFNELYYSSITNNGFFSILDFLWYDHPIFGVDVYWTKGKDLKIKDRDIDAECRIRLLELGFFRTSENYEKHLKRYGFDLNTKIEMDAHMI